MQATQANCGPVEGLDPQALGITLTFDAPRDGEPYPLTVRFVGLRAGATNPPAPGDTFDVVDTIAGVVPGSGTVSLTRRIEGITPGGWTVQARSVVDPSGPDRSVPATAQVETSTGYAPLIRVRAPGVRIGAWPALVGSGAAVALILQGVLASRFGLPTGQLSVLSLVACLLGLGGARLYYRLEYPRGPETPVRVTGMCIQGFVLAAIGTVVMGALLLGLPVGRLMDVTAPGLMAGMAIGRVGCFLGGCCAGRVTASRWGLWSSDRRLGVRRIPTQLVESACALLIGSVAGTVLLVVDTEPAGAVFVATIAAYTFGRQLLFPLRSLPRHTRYGRQLVMLSTGIASVGAGVALLLR
ncbi:prolipoprotein diacylglyceryl transferase [Pseudonocardia sp. KRD-169]|uniref:Prolipoprotein diacylglyceryl transferase n=1 Tax=Pseudonocardia abyssalis TaxID=2792008 RepID=A0ABS6UT30_9PSEU|nr:prolipoprotein diacylglyceryl transferase [Pseudonocardia abyssalis]MBW0134894.1 prolipoprotein diacylglyceryl transferase [Pseudonocardia abyssalis]